MDLLLGGCVVLAGVGVICAAVLPREGRVSRVVGTWLEPYAALTVVAGITSGLMMIIAGVMALLGV